MNVKYSEFTKLSHSNDKLLIEFKKTLWQWLLKKPRTVKIFVRTNGIWYSQDSTNRLSKYDMDLISYATNNATVRYQK